MVVNRTLSSTLVPALAATLALAGFAVPAAADPGDVVFADDFDDLSIDPGRWTHANGVTETAVCGTLAGAGALNFRGTISREIRTVPIALPLGGSLEFGLHFLNQASGACDRPEEPISVAASADGGATFVTLLTVGAGTPPTEFDGYQVVGLPLPAAPSLILRWANVASGFSGDAWQVDEVVVRGPGAIPGFSVSPAHNSGTITAPGVTVPAPCAVDPCEDATVTPPVPVEHPGQPIPHVCVPFDDLCLLSLGPFPGVPPIDEEVDPQDAPALCSVLPCPGPTPIGPVPLVNPPNVSPQAAFGGLDPDVDTNEGETERIPPAGTTVPEWVPVVGGGPVTVCPEHEPACARPVPPEASGSTWVAIYVTYGSTTAGADSREVVEDVQEELP